MWGVCEVMNSSIHKKRHMQKKRVPANGELEKKQSKPLMSRLRFSKEVVVVTVVVVVTAVLLAFLVPVLSSDAVVEFFRNLGWWAPAAIIAVLVLSEVFAPLPGTPGLVVGYAIYGWLTTQIIGFIAGIISSAIAFYIARRYGRSIVEKFVGKQAMIQVDEFAEVEGIKALAICRLLGFTLGDYVSYASGLTCIPFWTYILVSALCRAVVSFGYMRIFRNVDYSSAEGFLVWYGSMLALVPVFTILIRSYLKKKKKV